MEERNILIIGGGIGGLATGCYLQMNGYQTTIFEKNSVCGGVSVGWKRGGYIFDGSAEWLAGSSPYSNLHFLLEELIDFNTVTIIDPEEFIVIEYKGEVLRVFRNADRLYEEMMRIAPEDEVLIHSFAEAIKKMGTFCLPYEKPMELMGAVDRVKYLIQQRKFITFFLTWKKITLEGFADRFSNKHLGAMVKMIFPKHHYFSLFSIIATLGWMHIKSGGYVIGGSNTIAEVLQKKYESLGGRVKHNSAVTRIEVNNKRAEGISCADGQSYKGDIVISAADTFHTHVDLLDEQFLTPALRRSFNRGSFYRSLLMISLGIKKTLACTYNNYSIDFQTPLKVGTNEYADSMMVRIGTFDPTFAPETKTTIVARFRISDYAYWDNLRKNNPDKYTQEKERIAESAIQILENRFGNIKENCEVIDVATPATYIRYTNIYKGSFQGWAPTPSMVGKALKRTVPGLKNFYLTGQWVWPAGGLPGVIRIGRHTAQVICKKHGKQFRVI